MSEGSQSLALPKYDVNDVFFYQYIVRLDIPVLDFVSVHVVKSTERACKPTWDGLRHRIGIVVLAVLLQMRDQAHFCHGLNE